MTVKHNIYILNDIDLKHIFFLLTKLYLYDRPTRICFDLLRVVLHVKIYKGKNQFVARIWCKTMFVFILYNSLTNPEYKQSILKILGVYQPKGTGKRTGERSRSCGPTRAEEGRSLSYSHRTFDETAFETS